MFRMRTTTRLKAAAVMTAAGLLAAPAAAQAAIYPGPNGNQDVHGAIEAKWLALGRAPGAPLTNEIPLANQAGAFNDFTRQAIYWTAATGAHTVGGDIYRYWAARGWENGALGYPTSDEVHLARGGVLQRFQHGTVHWSPGNGAHQVSSEFATAWAVPGVNGDGGQWENGPLGYPTGDLAPAADGGTFQRFEHGAIYQRPSGTPADPLFGPAIPVGVSGAFYPYWAANGYERGRLGWPLYQEWPIGTEINGVYQPFQNGILDYTPCTGVTEGYAGNPCLS